MSTAAARLTLARRQTEGILQMLWRTCVTGAPLGRKTPATQKGNRLRVKGGGVEATQNPPEIHSVIFISASLLVFSHIHGAAFMVLKLLTPPPDLVFCWVTLFSANSPPGLMEREGGEKALAIVEEKYSTLLCG